MKSWAIALNTFREAVRDKILYNLLIFALAIIALSTVISNMTLGQRVKIVLDTGLGAMSIFGLLIAVFVGIQLVYKEIQRRTIYVLLAKPVARWEFILGKFLGLAMTLLVNMAVMTLTLMAVLRWFTDYPFPAIFFTGVLLIALELLVVTAVALFFSTFSTPTLSALFTLGVWVIGRLSTDLKIFGGISAIPGTRELTTAIYYLMPNLRIFDISTEVVYELPLPAGYAGSAVLYGLLYTSLVLVAAVGVFQRRDFR